MLMRVPYDLKATFLLLNNDIKLPLTKQLKSFVCCIQKCWSEEEDYFRVRAMLRTKILHTGDKASLDRCG